MKKGICENKKCLSDLFYYNDKTKRCVKKPNCKSGEYFNEQIKKCESKEKCKLGEYFN